MSALTVAGLQKTSLIDFPGRISCVLFLSGCNFSCPYCHNPDLAQGRYPLRIPLAELLAFLEERRTFLEGVVITGGEPCLAGGLAELCQAVRHLGLAVKLDTNGSRPEVLRALIDAGILDYIAMDLKTAPSHYGPPWCPAETGKAILQSIEIIMASEVDYEFRTTCVPPFVDETLIQEMARAVRGAHRYILQRFNPKVMLDPAFFKEKAQATSPDDLNALQRLAAPLVKICKIR